MALDVPRLLAAARATAGLSQTQLADLSGVGRRTVNRYESGTAVPGVDLLERLLAACRLQLRVALEPLTDSADAALERLLQEEPHVEADSLRRVAAWLDADPAGFPLPGGRPHRTGPATWAFDRATALALHGFAAEQLGIDLVLVYDEAAAWWLTSLGILGSDERGRPRGGWLDLAFDQAEPLLRGLALGLAGPMRIRLVQELPPTVLVEGLPVVRVDEVERSHPEWSAVLSRLRQRGAVRG